MTRVTVFGSANMDLVATVERAPSLGETVTGRSFHTVPGGKGANQALAAARAGGEVRFVGAVGSDAYGAQIRSLLGDSGVDVAGLAVVDGPTGTAHITVDATGANSIIVVPGANGTLRSLTDMHRAAIATADVLLVQLELPLPAVVEAAQYARSSGVATVLTPAPVVPLPDELLDAVDLIVPNQHEAAKLGAQALASTHRDVLVTLGAGGVRYIRQGMAPLEIPAFAVDAVDTTAAGDTFVGAFAVAREQAELADALRWAAAAAALSVQRIGASASMPHRAEIDALLRKNSPC
jgi:ribokinase